MHVLEAFLRSYDISTHFLANWKSWFYWNTPLLACSSTAMIFRGPFKLCYLFANIPICTRLTVINLLKYAGLKEWDFSNGCKQMVPACRLLDAELQRSGAKFKAGAPLLGSKALAEMQLRKSIMRLLQPMIKIRKPYSIEPPIH